MDVTTKIIFIGFVQRRGRILSLRVYWFWYAFDFAKLYFGRGNVTTIPNLSQSKLAELPMALSPLPEQKKIAYILSTVQQAIEAQERIIPTITELKNALMQKLFTEGLARRTPETNRYWSDAGELGNW